jgi:hypothetical protein
MEVGIILERCASDHPWQDWSWRVCGLLPGGAAGERRLVASGEGWSHTFAGNLTLELYADQTPAYRHNLSSAQPVVYAVLRKSGDDGMEAFLITASPVEAQEYLVGSEAIVEAVRMPEEIMAFVAAFVDRQPPEEPFRKRRQKPKGGANDNGGGKAADDDRRAS